MQAKKTQKAVYSWEIQPEPITGAAREVRTQILVVGSGVAGVVTALAAAEEGARVVVLSRARKCIALGGSIFAFNSRLTKKFGINYNLSDVMQRVMMLNSKRVDEEAWSIFLRQSGRVMDWAMDYGEAHGLTPVLQNCEEITQFPIIGEYLGTHLFIGGKNGQDISRNPQQDLLTIFQDAAVKLGVDFRFRVSAKQLLREKDGRRRVKGLIALEEDGTYTRYLAEHVVLATGDYSKNLEMMEKFHPYLPVKDAPEEPEDAEGGPGGDRSSTGDGSGHLMALWAGGAWQKCASHAAIVFDMPGVSRPPRQEMLKPENLHIRENNFAFNMCNWHLAVNKFGERFHNEHCTFGWHGQQILTQPGQTCFNIYDANCVKKTGALGPGRLGGKPISEEESLWARCYGKGYSTLEEFAQAFDLPVEQFVKTVKRYNELCYKGADEDFFKPAEFMVPIEKPPFYGGRGGYFFLIAVGGLNCSSKMQALDKDDQVIPGLYYIGTVAGDFFSNMYSTIMPGANLGRTMTFGYLTGKALAGDRSLI
jgi:fumarate reductase flavoprotein subunit